MFPRNGGITTLPLPPGLIVHIVHRPASGGGIRCPRGLGPGSRLVLGSGPGPGSGVGFSYLLGLGWLLALALFGYWLWALRWLALGLAWLLSLFRGFVIEHLDFTMVNYYW